MTISANLRNKDFTFETKAGLFSKDKVDEGTRLLVENIDVNNGDIVIDLGCGYGVIGLVAASLTPQGKVYLVDTDIRAVKYSQINARFNRINNVDILASDGFENIPQSVKFDVVLSNPPSHMPKETIIEFIEGAKKCLNQKGRLYFVTEKRIRPMIKKEFVRVFGNYETVKSKFQYTVSLAYQNK